VTGFKLGDAVFYAGSIARPGTNSEYHLVDERIVGRKPATLSDAEAAALPLTAITAWEMLFDRLDVTRPTAEGGKTILVIGGAGGVGSITLQLLRARTDLTVIATASRPETQDWARTCGAHHVVDHRQPLAGAGQGAGAGRPRLRLLDHADRAAPGRHRRTDRTSGPLRADR
jgi:NADPH:quinone reductase-like Zn-dependent oxidoreductase